MRKKRLEEFDLLKGIGILLMVLGHSNINDTIHDMIYSFHMPLFFMVSGYFFRSQQPLLYLKKSFFRLIVPWLFFVVMNLVFFTSLNLLSTLNLTKSFHDTAILVNPIDEDCYLLYRSIWFLVVLFFIGNIYNLLSTLFSWQILNLIVVFFYLIGFSLQWIINVPFFIDTSASVLIFYHIGSLLKPVNEEHKINRKWWYISCLALFSVFMCITIIIKPGIDFKTNSFPIWTPLLSGPIIVVLFFIMQWLCKSSIAKPLKLFLMQCGASSICILGFHRLFQECFYIIYSKLGVQCSLLQTSVYIIVTIPAILFLSKLLEKYTPQLIGIKK